MEDKDKTIALLRKQLHDVMKKISALEQENAILSHQNDSIKNGAKSSIIYGKAVN